MNTHEQEIDYSNKLVLFSGGLGSSYFLLTTPKAKIIAHYTIKESARDKYAKGLSKVLTKQEEREVSFMYNLGELISEKQEKDRDFYCKLILDASSKAMRYGLDGVVICFNKDDPDFDFSSVLSITKIEIIQPLRNLSSDDIRNKLKNMGYSHLIDTSKLYAGYNKRGY